MSFGEPHGIPAPPPQVLVAEDDEILRDALVDMLAEHFKVVPAANGRDALDLARRFPPDVALVDYRMPGLNGVELAMALKREMPLIRVVMLTAYDDQALGLDAVRCGVHAFLVKGCKPSMIVDAVKRAVRDTQ